MPSTYSTNLRVELMAQGENDSTWGTKNNTSIQLLEAAIAGRAAVTHDDTANYTLTTANGSADEARRMIIDIGGALGAARNAVVPTQTKFYVVKNSTTGGYAVTVKTSGGTGIAVPNGKTMLLFCDGTNVVEAINQLVGTLGVGGLLTTSAGISIPTGQSVTGAGTATVTGFATVSATTLTGTLSTAAQPNVTSVGTLTSLTVTNSLTAGAISGTTGTFGGQITSTMGNSAVLFNAASATTGYQIFNLQNTGAQTRIGIESSAGGGQLPGSSAYSGILGNVTNTDLHIFTNNTIRGTFSSTGLAVTGTLSTASFLETTEIAAPAAGAANTARIFAVDSGGGKTILKVQFATGAAQTLATEP